MESWFDFVRRIEEDDPPAITAQGIVAPKRIVILPEADGDVVALAQALPRWAPPGAKLLHASGAEGQGRLALLLTAKGYGVRSDVLYDVVASTTLPDAVVEALASLDAAVFFSPRSAWVFAQCTVKAGLATACARLTALCISDATASALAPLVFAVCRIAKKPNQDALLACLG